MMECPIHILIKAILCYVTCVYYVLNVIGWCLFTVGCQDETVYCIASVVIIFLTVGFMSEFESFSWRMYFFNQNLSCILYIIQGTINGR